MVNDTDFDRFTKDLFSIDGAPPTKSMLVCRICKEPPKYLALCNTKIFYVHRKDFSQRACIHIGIQGW